MATIPHKDDGLQDQKVDASPIQITNADESKTEQLNLKPSRELKLLLELSKEANLETNISYKRKCVEPAKTTEKLSKSTPAMLTNVSQEEQGKRSMRSQNPNFLLKHKFMSRFLVDSENVEHAEKNPNDSSSKSQKKKKENFGETFTDGAIDEKTRKLLKPVLTMVQNNKDGFCWRCHRDKINISCSTCPRSYHIKCSKHDNSSVDHWICTECVAILTAESTKSQSTSMKEMTLEHLCGLLKFALKRMMQCTDAEPFIHPVNTAEFRDYKQHIVQPMDLTKLEKNIKDNTYGSTVAFEADAKWMLHNSIIYNSCKYAVNSLLIYNPKEMGVKCLKKLVHSKLTTIAKAMIKVCKQEMQEIENCSSCYLKANTKKDWFVEVCPKPHILLWAKLKGFPYWPAKAMCTNSQGMVDVRFFGAHDRAWVSSKECFLFSQKDPNCNKQKRNDINECIKELNVHIENLKKVYGEFNYAPYRTLFDPEMETNQMQIFLPGYKPNIKSPGKINNSDQNNSKPSNETPESKDLNGSIISESIAVPKTGPESNDSIEVQSKVDDLNKEMEGYGTDEDSDSIMYKHSSKSEEIINENNEEVESGSHIKLSDKLHPLKQQTPKNLKRASNDEISFSLRKISRRESMYNARNDSNKINVLNVAEDVEITLGNNDDNLKVLEKTSPSKLSQEQIGSLKEAVSGKFKIAERLMKRFTENVKQTESSTCDNEKPKESRNDMETSDLESISHIKQVILGDISAPKAIKDKMELINFDDNKITKTVEDQKSDVNCSDDLLEELYSENVSEGEDDTTTELHRQTKKRKHILENATTNEGQRESPTQKKLIKLVDINVIKKSLCEKMGLESISESILEKHLKKIELDEEKLHTDEEPETSIVKSEPNSDEEALDNNYMEAKRQYLNALNISEKMPSKEAVNITKFKAVDNVTKVIDSVASSYSEEHDGEEIFLKENKTKLGQKQRARKSFPKPTFTVQHFSPPAPSKTTMNESQKINNVLFLTQSHSGINNITMLPHNQTVAYSTGLTSPILTMVQHPVTSNPFANIIVPSSSVNLSSSSQNYIPQRNPDIQGTESLSEPIAENSSTSETVAFLTTPTNVTASNIEVPVNTSTTANNSNPSFTLLNGQNLSMPNLCKQTTVSSSADLIDDINILSGVVPENITKAITDLMCRTPPKLKSRPPGPLSASFDSGIPSSAGPVATVVNSISHRLTDYFRWMLTETLQDLGKGENPQAIIASLRLENEMLKHKQSEEISEIKKNVNSILKDIQTSILEEKERLINETKSTCQAELIKRVEEAKSKQWCANCMKEAQFYCCWNTSYCDYPCQLKHWPKHMTKCTQNSGTNQQTLPNNNNNNTISNNNNNSPKTQVQPLILRKTTAPKTFPAKTLVGAWQANKNKSAPVNTVMKAPLNNTLTIIEPTPGNYEILGNGPISVGAKIINTTVFNKIKPGNIITVPTSTNTSLSSGGSQPQKVILTQTKPPSPAKPTISEVQK